MMTLWIWLVHVILLAECTVRQASCNPMSEAIHCIVGLSCTALHNGSTARRSHVAVQHCWHSALFDQLMVAGWICVLLRRHVNLFLKTPPLHNCFRELLILTRGPKFPAPLIWWKGGPHLRMSCHLKFFPEPWISCPLNSLYCVRIKLSSWKQYQT